MKTHAAKERDRPVQPPTKGFPMTILAQAEAVGAYSALLNLGAAGVGFATMYLLIDYVRSRDKAFTDAMKAWCEVLAADSKAGREQAQAFLNAQVVINQSLTNAVAKSAMESALQRECCQQRMQLHPPSGADGQPKTAMPAHKGSQS